MSALDGTVIVPMLGRRGSDKKGVVVNAAHARAYRITVSIHRNTKEQDK